MGNANSDLVNCNMQIFQSLSFGGSDFFYNTVASVLVYVFDHAFFGLDGIRGGPFYLALKQALRNEATGTEEEACSCVES